MAEWTGFLGVTMLWVKAAHVIFVIFLMAGLFMMPRFFVYHHQCAVGSDEDRKWIEREDRLRKIILNPSLVIVWILGLMLAFNGGYWSQGWFHAKLLLVLLLSGYHGWTIGYFKKLKRGERPLSEKRLRMLNEVPGVAAAIIVILAVVRPF
ncbi:CopD family protein [Sphingopyxis terrae]|uniref:Protoporphyrinogen IX oxidase n=1 Tax=Sphingopyxis terrae subsp. ummariensis TaxID=429001 RepID=A0A1Y6FVP5_9SPHN|nr:CopD family protein [Sphingopyxis terrae]PCF90250.1 CopD family protein [Sphingopyxis terrae subsp. ummariensis]SMQ79304.1 putative membrane protein [Sphingopyxis terrae subsp. ummariensis]